jgi:formylmethanofuran dehydrogenase subunit A
VLKLSGGRILDPTNGRDEIGDLWLDGGRIVAPPAGGFAGETYDLAGMLVMAGGIDIHSHIASANANLARRMLVECRNGGGDPRLRDATLTPRETGRRYAEMGFTLVVDPAVNPLDALHAHLELAAAPIIDTAALLILGSDDFLLRLLTAGEGPEATADYVGAVLAAGRGLGVKAINAGGAEAFKHNLRSFGLDDPVPSRGNLTSRRIVSELQKAVHALGVPHPLHVHANNLGLAGSAETTLATMEAAKGLPLHIAHLQFYAYGAEGRRGLSSGAAALAEKVNATPTLTVDVGQVMFGATVTVSSDTLRQHGQSGFARPRKWTLWETDGEGGGVFPIQYRRGRFASALQWAIGLELFLRIGNPRQVYFTTDHPNGAPFTAYPELFGLLMDADERDRWCEGLPPDALKMTGLRALRREYSPYEIAAMTRAAPARLLGLADRGHLGAGAVADVAAYRDLADHAEMFRSAAYLFKDGELAVRDGEVLAERPGRTLCVETFADATMARRLAADRERRFGAPAEAFAVREEAVARVAGSAFRFEGVPCRT